MAQQHASLAQDIGRFFLRHAPVAVRAGDVNEDHAQQLRYGVEKKKPVRSEPFADEAAEQRTEGEADSQCRRHLALNPALAFRRAPDRSRFF